MKLTVKQQRRMDDDWHRKITKCGVATMATMFRWFRNPAHNPHYGSALAAYRAARAYATGGQIPVTLSRLPK